MTILTEGVRDAAFLISEANDWRSRDEVTVTATGAALDAGTVLGKITSTGKYVLHDNAAVDGSENAAAILLTSIGAEEATRTIIARDAEVNGLEIGRAHV